MNPNHQNLMDESKIARAESFFTEHGLPVVQPAQADASREHNPPPEPENAPLDFRAILAAHKFDLNNPPPPYQPVYVIDNQGVGSAGNITGIQAPPKMGKSAAVGAFVAAAIQPGTPHLGITCNLTEGQILHFDCEQSKPDHHDHVVKALRRAGHEHATPEWLHSYWFTPIAIEVRRETFFAEMEFAYARGPIRAVFLDGGADILNDTNDQKESNALVTRLHQAAIKYSTVIFVIIHENPGINETGKTRGHFGSQIQRKAETNLRIHKDPDGTMTIYTESSRHCHIPKEHGARFAYDVAQGMFLAIESLGVVKATKKERDAESRRQEEIEELKNVLADSDNGIMSYSELNLGFQKKLLMKYEGAKTRIRRAKEGNMLVEATGGGWMLNPKL